MEFHENVDQQLVPVPVHGQIAGPHGGEGDAGELGLDELEGGLGLGAGFVESNIGARRSGDVSTSSRSPALLSTAIETRVRRFLGSLGSHSPHSWPIRGTPVDVPEPSTISFTRLLS